MAIDLLLAQIEKAGKAAEAAKGEIDGRWTPEAQLERRKEIDAQLASRIEPLQEEAEDDLAWQLEAANIKHYNRRREFGPQTPGEWTEAQARAPFVAAELAELEEPRDILERFTLAGLADDTVGAYLVWFQGSQLLRAWLEDPEHAPTASTQGPGRPNIAARASIRQVYDELQALALGDVEKAHAERLGAIQQQRVDLVRLLNRYQPGDRPRIGF
jgi:hypothetical protein